jgi:hypothetical protein
MILLALSWWASGAEAACSGSGLSWSCTAGSTATQINSAINSASDQAVITLAAGSYTVTGIDMAPRNGLTIICATQGACTFTASGNEFLSDHSCTGPRTNLMRISGMTFTGSAGGTARIWWVCQFGHTFTKVRIDHNTFINLGQGNIAILFGGNGRYAAMYGVVDHNTFGDGTDANHLGMKNMSGGNSTDWLVGARGSANNMFFEDNSINFGTDNPSAAGFLDSWSASSTVARFNTAVNSRYVTHSYCHGGPFNQETYYNDISQPDAAEYRNLHYQGSGEIIAFFNRIVKGHFAIQHFRADPSTATTEGSCNSLADGTVTGTGTGPTTANDGNRTLLATYRGYPAWHQPGRDKNAALKPVYSIRNLTETGALVRVSVETGSWPGSCGTGANLINCQFISNRDLYESVSANTQTSPTSPFNGTVGVGHGTLANRPTTCTPTSEALDAGNGGVGYWATDQGSWNTSTSNPYGVQANGADGVLYTCTATNTWTATYTPYTYPHPLQAGGGGGGGDINPPAAPVGLMIQ